MARLQRPSTVQAMSRRCRPDEGAEPLVGGGNIDPPTQAATQDDYDFLFKGSAAPPTAILF
jgi:hypothetical protein